MTINLTFEASPPPAPVSASNLWRTDRGVCPFPTVKPVIGRTFRVGANTQKRKDGLPAREIGLQIGATRNAVLGKLKRLGLSGRSDYYRAPARFVVMEPKQALPPPPPPAPIPSKPVNIFRLTNKHCRFPLWDDPAIPIHKKFHCGRPTADISAGRSYCAEHGAVEFQRRT